MVARATATRVEADFYVPPGFTGDTYGIAPDSVVAAMAERYDLVRKSRLADPACGAYTMPRVLRTLGAQVVDAADISPEYYAIAKKEADKLTARKLGRGVVAMADLAQPLLSGNYDGIYTSLPFSWFARAHEPDPMYAQSIADMLAPEGILIVDSADSVLRDGQEISVARRQIAYFEDNGFTLADSHLFEAVTEVPGFDTMFRELVFQPEGVK